MTGNIISILGIAGSLRKDSYNKSILRTALGLLPADASMDIFDLEGLPLFNQDLEMQPHEKVQAFKAAIRQADAILIATPEYNYSVPGVLKNAIDVGSRPYGDSAWDGKPVALMGASIGMLGTARSQYHLRQTFVCLNMHPVNQPEIMIPFAQDKIDAGGNLTDEKTKALIAKLIQNLVVLARKLRQ